MSIAGWMRDVSTVTRLHVNRNLLPTRLRESGWITPDIPERDMTPTDRRTAIARSRQMVEEDPFVAGMMASQVDHVVGQGYRLFAKTGDSVLDREIESAWNEERDAIDVRKVRPWGQLVRCWQYRKLIDGDVALLHLDEDARYCVQTVESDRIYRSLSDPVDSGIEFDETYGQPLRYYIGPRVPNDLAIRSKLADGSPHDANNVYLLAAYPHERAERARGWPVLVQCLALFQDISEIMEAMRANVKKQAFYAMEFRIQPGPNGSLFGGNSESLSQDDDGSKARRRLIKMVPGMGVRTNNGEQINMLETKSPNSEHVPYLRFLLRYAGVRIGMPLEMLLLDFGDTNYSGGRGLLELTKRRFATEVNAAHAACTAVYRRWMRWHRAMRGDWRNVPAGVNVEAHRWSRPPWPYLNPTDELNAMGEAIDRCLMTHEEAMSELWGGEFTEVVRRLGAESKEKAAAGLANVINARMQTVEIVPTADKETAGVNTDLTLNGAQIAAAIDVIAKLEANVLAEESAIVLLVAVGITKRDAAEMVRAQRAVIMPREGNQ